MTLRKRLSNHTRSPVTRPPNDCSIPASQLLERSGSRAVLPRKNELGLKFSVKLGSRIPVPALNFNRAPCQSRADAPTFGFVLVPNVELSSMRTPAVMYSRFHL